MNKNNNSDNIDLLSMSTRGKRKNKRNKFLIITNVLASFVLVFSIVGLSLILALGARPMDFSTDDQIEWNENPPDVQSTSSQVSYILVLGLDESEALTDVMMVVCMDHEKDTASILQIPRDTFIGTDIPSGRINAVYGSPKNGESKINYLRRRLASHLAIPLDHYIVFTLNGFKKVVDALGGVDVNIKQKNGIRIEDHTTKKKHIIGPGKVHMDGKIAEGFIRKRYGSEEGYGKGDISRVENQRIFYAALAEKVKNMNFSQLTKIITTCSKDIKTSMTTGEMLGYAKEAMKIDLNEITINGLPGQACNYNGRSYYSIHKEAYLELFNSYLNPYGDPMTADKVRAKELHSALGIPTQRNWFKDDGSLGKVSEQTGQK